MRIGWKAKESDIYIRSGSVDLCKPDKSVARYRCTKELLIDHLEDERNV